MNYYQYNSFDELFAELKGSTVLGLACLYRDPLTFTPTVFLLPESPTFAADIADEINELSTCFVGGFYNCWSTDWWFEKEEDAMMCKLRWLSGRMN